MGHMNATISFGWLDVSRGSVRYQVEQPPEKSQDSFEVPRAQIRHLEFLGLFVEFSNPKLQRIFYLPPSEWQSLHSGLGIVSAAQGGQQATQSIARAIENFDFALSLARPPAPPPPVVEPRPASPTPSPPQPAAPEVAAVAAPNLVLTAPAGALGKTDVEIDTSPLVIRGAVVDAAGIPTVSINGLPANMRPQSPQAAEFWSDPLPLQAGDNRFEISAANAKQAESHLTVVVHYAPKAPPANPRALSKQDILDLLRGGVPAGRVVELVNQRGIKFRPVEDDLSALRAAGANDEVIQAIRNASHGP
jgi:hypothetical protein